MPFSIINRSVFKFLHILKKCWCTCYTLPYHIKNPRANKGICCHVTTQWQGTQFYVISDFTGQVLVLLKHDSLSTYTIIKPESFGSHFKVFCLRKKQNKKTKKHRKNTQRLMRCTPHNPFSSVCILPASWKQCYKHSEDCRFCHICCGIRISGQSGGQVKSDAGIESWLSESKK